MLLIQANFASGVGIGVYGSAGLGSQSWTESDYMADREFDTDSTLAGIGFMLDTAVSRTSLFNYRLAVGYERRAEENGDGGHSTDFDIFTMAHTFGFAVVRAQAVRVWIGPELRIFGGSAEVDGPYGSSDLSMLGFAIGPALGANIHLGGLLSLCISASPMYSLALVESSDDLYDDFDADVDGFIVDVRAALLFRMGEHPRH
jgi:hypothetical protein